MALSNLSIIFVAGAWHGEFHIQPIVPFLEQYGYRVVPVKLKTSEKHDPPPSLEDNISLIHGLIESEVRAGYRVCLVGHSVSGISCAAALSRFFAGATPEEKSKIVHVMFIACFLEIFRATEGATWYTVDWEAMVAMPNTPIETFYNDMPEDEAKPFAQALDFNLVHIPEEGVIGELWREVNAKTYFVCLKDNAIPPDRQYPEANENGMQLVEVNMDHCPYVSRPKDFAEEMHRALSR